MDIELTCNKTGTCITSNVKETQHFVKVNVRRLKCHPLPSTA